MSPEQFQTLLLGWYDQAGRKDLPWQRDRTPYRVWVSEIMLQQTQVTTVIPYFERFISAFPTVMDLAQAEIDQVLHLWAGLGYYSRARNLHRTARQVFSEYHGQMPNQVALLCRLPGIGRSTAGAIVSLAFAQPAPILDGNVKRLWTRLYGIDTWPGESQTERKLWQLSERYLPMKRPAEYTQALMDFGATLCTRSRPICGKCPFQAHCHACQWGLVDKIPTSRPQRPKPVRQDFWLLLREGRSRLYLEQRPAAGIWGGLWAFPSWNTRDGLERHCENMGIDLDNIEWLNARRHTFTHFQLEYVPALVNAEASLSTIRDRPSRWIEPGAEPQVAVPAPVRNLLSEFGRSDVLT